MSLRKSDSIFSYLGIIFSIIVIILIVCIHFLDQMLYADNSQGFVWFGIIVNSVFFVDFVLYLSIGIQIFVVIIIVKLKEKKEKYDKNYRYS